MPFQKGKEKTGGKKKGNKAKKTILKETIESISTGRTFEDTRKQVIQNMQDELFSDNPDTRKKATKEYANYFVATRKENVNTELTFEEYLKKYCEDGQAD